MFGILGVGESQFNQKIYRDTFWQEEQKRFHLIFHKFPFELHVIIFAYDRIAQRYLRNYHQVLPINYQFLQKFVFWIDTEASSIDVQDKYSTSFVFIFPQLR